MPRADRPATPVRMLMRLEERVEAGAVVAASTVASVLDHLEHHRTVSEIVGGFGASCIGGTEQEQE